MKIGFDAKRAFLNQTGLGNYSRNILLSLKKYFPENDYLLFTPEIKKEIFPEQSDFDVYSPDSPVSKIFKSLWRSFSLSSQLEKQNIDLFHGLTHELPAGIHKTGVKSVVTIHDLIFLRYPQFYKPIDREIYLQKIKYACHVAHKVIAVSNQTRDDIIHFLKIQPEKIDVVYQGISERFFSENLKNKFPLLKATYNLPDNYILSLGTIEARKNQLNIVKAMATSKVDLPLVLVGKPTSYATQVSDYISNYRLDRNVFFLDQVIDEDLPCLYQNAELLVYTSFFEGFGLPIIEAMASGCPVLTSNISSMPETGSGAALYCDPGNVEKIGDSIKKIIEDKNLKNQLSQMGKIRAQEFTPEKTASALMETYFNVLSHV